MDEIDEGTYLEHHKKTSTARQIRSSIKSIVAQLDAWDGDQRLLATRRTQANLDAGGWKSKEQLAIARAKESLGTQELEDPPCNECGSTSHLTEECDDFYSYPVTGSPSLDRHQLGNPSVDIHRGIVHRLYAKTCELYLCLYPRSYPERNEGTIVVHAESEEIYPQAEVSNSDYQSIAIREAATDLWQLRPSAVIINDRGREERIGYICRLYYSKAFPLDFLEFHELVVQALEELDEFP